MNIARLLHASPPVWLCPFRAFFLLTAIHAALGMAAWLGMLGGLLPLPAVAGGAVVWHAHEMLFGFAMASIVGFLLTAVPEFTGTAPVGQVRLQVMAGLWLVGRLGFTLSGWLSAWPAAIADLALLGTLLASVAQPLWQQPDRRHVAFIYNLLLLTLIHGGFYAALLGGNDPLPWLRLSIGALMMLIVVALSRISMRLVNDAIHADTPNSPAYLARPPRRNLALFTIAAYSTGEFLLPGNAVCGWLALAAAAGMLNLLNDWHVGRALLRRWALIPYLVYVSMAAGYSLIGAHNLAGLGSASTGEHLLLIAALGLAVWIVMAVAGRMHSGWGLDQRRWLPLGAGLLLAGALLRAVNGPNFITGAALLWISAWVLYLCYSLRPLAGPRPDSLAGCAEPAAPAESAAQRPVCGGA